jgi:hypothetical protein
MKEREREGKEKPSFIHVLRLRHAVIVKIIPWHIGFLPPDKISCV